MLFLFYEQNERNASIFWFMPFEQHYPPGTQENYNSFASRNIIMGKGNELEFPIGGHGVRGTRGFPLGHNINIEQNGIKKF
jgi:hypothetical protein